jgi:hypothetical protein
MLQCVVYTPYVYTPYVAVCRLRLHFEQGQGQGVGAKISITLRAGRVCVSIWEKGVL